MSYTGLYNADGAILTTQVSGSVYTGLYSPDGNLNIVLNTSSTYLGKYHPCGALNAVIVTDSSASSIAANGSINVFANNSGGYSPVTNIGRIGGLTAIPQLGNLVTRFSADAITPQANNSALASWTDSVNGIVAGTIVGAAPTYTTNRIGTKPSVKFTGFPANTGLSIAAPGVMKTAIDSLDFTVFIVFKQLDATAQGNASLLSATAGGATTFHYVADGSNVAKQQNGALLTVPYAGQTAFSTFGSTSFNTTPNFSSSGFLQALYVNGGAVTSLAVSAVGTGGVTLAIGNNAGNNFPANAEIFDILIWNKPLTPAQYMQAQMWACDKYAQPYPWAGLTRFNVFFGDSITQGVGASTVSHQAPYLAAQSLGLSLGQWSNVAVGGITTNNMGVLAPTWVDPIPALIKKKTAVTGFEWHNQQDATVANGAVYLAARKAISNLQTNWGTSTSEILDPIANRALYDTAWDAAHANCDSYMAIHTDPHIGQNGNYASFSSAGDGVHLPDATQPFLAALFVAGINALP